MFRMGIDITGCNVRSLFPVLIKVRMDIVSESLFIKEGNASRRQTAVVPFSGTCHIKRVSN